MTRYPRNSICVVVDVLVPAKSHRRFQRTVVVPLPSRIARAISASLQCDTAAIVAYLRSLKPLPLEGGPPRSRKRSFQLDIPTVAGRRGMLILAERSSIDPEGGEFRRAGLLRFHRKVWATGHQLANSRRCAGLFDWRAPSRAPSSADRNGSPILLRQVLIGSRWIGPSTRAPSRASMCVRKCPARSQGGRPARSTDFMTVPRSRPG